MFVVLFEIPIHPVVLLDGRLDVLLGWASGWSDISSVCFDRRDGTADTSGDTTPGTRGRTSTVNAVSAGQAGGSKCCFFLALGHRRKHAGVGLHLARESSGSLGSLRVGQTVQPIGNDGARSNDIGNAAKDAIIGRRCLGRRGVPGRRGCTTNGGGSSTPSLDVAAQVATSSTMSSTGAGSSAEEAARCRLAGASGRDRGGGEELRLRMVMNESSRWSGVKTWERIERV